MPTPVALHELQQLITAGAQLVEVLPAEEYEESHLPGAINLPLKQLNAQSAAAPSRSASPSGTCDGRSSPTPRDGS
jgi:rhodanese-related sulfurtransferase